MIYVGIDWAESEHAVCVLDETGSLLAEQTIPDTIDGSRELHRLLAEHATEPSEVVIASETEHGLLMRALQQTGYQLYAINPLLASRYRERTSASGAKSDPGDARMLADLVRLDRHRHRPIAGDSTAVQALRVLTRAHQELIWSRHNSRPISCAVPCGSIIPVPWLPSTGWMHPRRWPCSSAPRRPPKDGA